MEPFLGLAGVLSDSYLEGEMNSVRKRHRKTMASLSAVAVLLTIFTTVLATPTAVSAQSPWKTCSLPLNLGPATTVFPESTDTADPLHWHFGRVANLTARPLGMLRPPGEGSGDPLPDFNNFEDRDSTQVFEDEAGVEWILQPPGRSLFHQPDLGLAEGLFNLTEEKYSMRKFMTAPDSSGRTFELVLQPDDLNSLPYRYEEQKVYTIDQNGNFLGGTVNFGGNDFSHYFHDVLTHQLPWNDNQGRRFRSGGDYFELRSEDNVIRPWSTEIRFFGGSFTYTEPAGAFAERAEDIMNNLDEIRDATLGTATNGRIIHKLQLMEGRNGGYQFRLEPSGSGYPVETIDVRPELNHVIEAYMAYKGTSLSACG